LNFVQLHFNAETPSTQRQILNLTIKEENLMNPHRCILHFISVCLILVTNSAVSAQKQKTPPGGHVGVVVDERLSALRTTPDLTGKLVRRLGRGRLVAVRGVRTTPAGIVFYLVNVTSRTHGWIQREAIVAPWRRGDDERLVSLIRESSDFDRIARARIFLDYFSRSVLRPEVLLLLGNAAEQVCDKLSRDAARRISDHAEAPEFSFFLNYPGLDRYNRQGIRFVFDEATRRLHYDGAAWREIVRHFPRSLQAVEAKRRLAAMK
jgi:hypothetical protein